MPTAQSAPPSGLAAEPEFHEFSDAAPDVVSDAGSKSWIVRSQNCVVVYTEAEAGDTFPFDSPTESMFLFPDDARRTIVSGSDTVDVDKGAIVIVPPGPGTLTIHAACVMTQLFTVDYTAKASLARNAASYAEPHANVAFLEPWPDPPAGFALRVYDLDDHPRDPNRMGRIFRSTNMMVNFLYPSSTPRPESKLSPHYHDDFEQISLQLYGTYVHHIRTPWTHDAAEWREDVHRKTTSPSATIIPPPTVHTSSWPYEEPHLLIDIFCGPRFDFSQKEGWVINADEYPMPGDV